MPAMPTTIRIPKHLQELVSAQCERLGTDWRDLTPAEWMEIATSLAGGISRSEAAEILTTARKSREAAAK